MKKKILAAFVCAATVLSLAGCASDAEKNALANIASNAANNASKATSQSTSTPATSKSGETNGSVNNAENSTANKSTPISELEYKRNSREFDVDETISITGYKGTNGTVVIPSEINGIKVTRIATGAFENNMDITSITIPATVYTIFPDAFNQCINLNEVIFLGDEVPHFSIDSFEGTPWLETKKAENPQFLIVGNALIKGLNCANEITIPDGVTKIYNEAFQNLSVTNVNIPDSVTEIGENAFSQCSYLENINIPNGVKVINSGTFSSCKKLKNITIPDSVTEIGASAFSGTAIKSITIPDSVTKIGDYAFYSLKGEVTIPDGVIELGTKAFSSGDVTVVYRGKSYRGVATGDFTSLVDVIKKNYVAETFSDRDIIITDNILERANPTATKIELPDTVIGIAEDAFKDCNKSLVISYKGKNYNLANLDRLKADISAN